MTDFPDGILYSPDHTWVRVEDGEGTVGITSFAQDQLGEVVFIELPEPGRSVTRGEPFGVIESVKVVQDLLAPAGGEVLARNEAVVDNPALVNDSPYGDGWMVRLRLNDPSEIEGLLDAAGYRSSLGTEAQ